jgi:single-strand DNA-binding protein
MAGNFNKVFLMGNLTRDVELRHTSGNQAVANIGLAVNRRYTTQSGEKREEVTWVDCEAWGRTAEVMSQYLGKGRPVFIEGRLKLDQWTDKEGNKQSKLRVLIENFQFVDSRGGGEEGGGGGGGSRPASRPAGGGGGSGGGGGPRSAPAGYDDTQTIDHDDIPF